MAFGIWNNIDELALYLGIDRLPKESDDDFKNRLYNVSRYMFKNDSYSQLKSMAAQCGLEVKPLIQINSDDDFICKIDYNYFTIQTNSEYLRVFIGNDNITVQNIIDGLEKLSSVNYVIYTPGASGITVKSLVKNTNFKIAQEFISESDAILNNTNIITGSLDFEDKYNYIYEKESLIDVKAVGDYFVDYKNGWIKAKDISSTGQIIKYKYVEKPFVIEYSELSLTPINHYFEYGITKQGIALIEFLLNNNVWE